MTTVRNILQSKGTDVLSISPDTKVSTALELMAEKNVGALVVVREGTLAGIFSERDFARKMTAKGIKAYEATVKELMTSIVFTVTPDQSIDECMTAMTGRRIRHLPVLEQERLIGIISIGDVVKAVISDKEQLIEQLKSYITGSR